MSYHYQYSNQIALQWVIENLPHFLFPDLSKKKDRIKKPFSGVLATLNQQPVGLILASYEHTGTQARVHSFAVHPEHQKKGVGAALLQNLTEHLAQEGCQQIEGYFRSHWASAPVLGRLLDRLGWDKPTLDLVIVRGEPRHTLHLFQEGETRLPEGYALSPFHSLTLEERAAIRQKKQQENWYADDLDPFIYEESINPRSSLLVRFQGEVVGWVISHLITPETNEFTSFFIDPGHRPFRLAYFLMREAITRQHEDEIPYFLITSKADGNPMVRFLLRHIPSHDVFSSSAYYSLKRLP